MSYSQMTLTAFSDELAAASAAPGGGSAAALAGALGASLVAMVCRLTIGRKNYEAVQAEFEAILPRAEARRAELMELMQEDADAYTRVMGAYQLKKETDEERKARTDAIQRGLKEAAEVPLRVAKACADVLEMSESAALKGNKNAASDGGAGALMAEAGLRAAMLNVKINLGLIQDDVFKARLRNELGPVEAAAGKRQAILDGLEGRIG